MLETTIEKLSNKKCTGCGACFNKCPVSAIKMEYDTEGFLFPKVNSEKCIQCGLCQKVCPELQIEKTVQMIHPEGKCYAVMADDEIRLVSSSGGMFTLLAEYVLEQGGVVCGATYSDDYMTVKHILVSDKKELTRLRGSKYVQSQIGTVYQEIKNELNKKRIVLFVGCPCQVAGLYSYLGKDIPGLFTADLVCHAANSVTAYQSFIKEMAKGRVITEVNFRDKSVYGWSTPTTISFQDGTVSNEAWNQSKWYSGFLGGIINRKCCSTCRYAQRMRIGDLTLGDFWQVHRWDKTCNDWKGTSLVLVNSKKGKELFRAVKNRMKLCKEAPLDFAVQYNGQLVRPNKAHPGRRFFFHHLPKDGYHKSLWYGQKWRYDVGLVGWWFAANYGSVMTYFALGKILEDMDLLAIMIPIPKVDRQGWEPITEKNIEFMKKYFPIANKRPIEKIDECNRFCDSFMVGSDQLWVQSYVPLVGYTFFLDFVDPNKKKIAYATSLGREEYSGSMEDKTLARAFLKQFDYISVRESSGVEICKKSFGLDAVRMLDPVFLCQTKYYDELADQAKISIKGNYLLCYILDPSSEKERAVEYLESKLNLKAYVIFDMKTFEKSKKTWSMDNVLENVRIEDFLALIKNCSYLLSDSHHGVCFGLIYHKDFICIANRARGYTRFESLFNLLNIREHMVENPLEILDHPSLLKSIDYVKVDHILKGEKKRSLNWLKNALNAPKNEKYDWDTRLLVKYHNMLKKQNEGIKKMKLILKELDNEEG